MSKDHNTPRRDHAGWYWYTWAWPICVVDDFGNLVGLGRRAIGLERGWFDVGWQG